jgi:hypothetical protein
VGAQNLLLAQSPGATADESDFLFMTLSGGQRCLSITDGASGPTSETCDRAAPAQDMQFTGMRLRAVGGICVVAPQASAGVELVTGKCEGSLGLWTVRNGTVNLTGTTLCATVEGGVFALGTRIILSECGSVPSWQTFQFVTGLIDFGGLCFSVWEGQPVPGMPIRLWNGCGASLDSENEQFYVSGPLRSAGSDKCADGQARAASNWVTLAECDGGLTQEWDYYW